MNGPWDALAQWALIILAVVAVLVAAGQCGARSSARADLLAERADSLATVVADRDASIARMAQDLARADSAYTADSVRWQAERAQNRAQIATAERSASEAAARLRPRLDSLSATILADYEAEVARERTAHRALVKSLDTEIASLRTQVKRRDELIAALYTRIDISNDRAAALAGANDALRAALRSRGRQNTLLKVAGIGLLGLAVYNGVQG